MHTVTLPLVEASLIGRCARTCVRTTYVVEASDLRWIAGEWPDRVVFCNAGKFFILEKLSAIDGRPDLGYIYKGLSDLGVTTCLEVLND